MPDFLSVTHRHPPPANMAADLGVGLLKDVRDDVIDKLFGEVKVLFPRSFKKGSKAARPLIRTVKRAAEDLRKDFAEGQRDLSSRAKRTARGRTRGTVRVRSILDRASSAGKRVAERPFDFRGQKRGRSDDGPTTNPKFRPPPPDMPHGRRPMRSRGSVKSRSRNIRSNLTESRPMRSVALRSKFAEVKYGTQSISLTNGLMTLISDPAQGDANNERIGDEIRALGLSIQLQAYKQTGSAITDLDQWRFTVFQWLPNSTVSPTPADIFTNVPAGQPARQFFNLQRRPLYKVLYDVSGALTGEVANLMLGNSTTGIQKVNLTIPNKTITYDPGTDNGVNNVYVLFQSASTSIAPPLGQMTYRFTYTDS